MKFKMRIRRKKWAKEELENAKFYIDKPDEFKGTWKNKFKNPNLPLYVELGCGKGSFIANLASNHKEDANYIAVDMIEAMLGLSKRNIEEKYNYDVFNYFNDDFVYTDETFNNMYKNEFLINYRYGNYN